MILILQRYLQRDLVKTFLMALVAVTAVMVVLAVGQALNRSDIPAKHILRAVPQFLPEVLAFTIPATMLFGTTLVYGRFARDNEFDAVRMSGIHPLVIVVPSVVMGAVLSCVVFYLTAELIPRAHYRLKNLATNVDVLADAFFATLDDLGTVRAQEYSIAAGSREGHTVRDVTIEKRNKETNRLELKIKAGEATFEFDRDEAVVWVEAKDAEVETFGAQPTAGYKRQIYRQAMPLPEPPSPGPRDLPLGQLLARLRAEDQPIAVASSDVQEAPAEGGRATEEVDRRLAQADALRRRHLVEVHVRLNAAVSSLSFVLVGVPLAVRFRRGHMLAAFLTAMGPMLLFHLVTFQARNLAIGGSWPPATPWAANALLWVLSAALLWPFFRR